MACKDRSHSKWSKQMATRSQAHISEWRASILDQWVVSFEEGGWLHSRGQMLVLSSLPCSISEAFTHSVLDVTNVVPINRDARIRKLRGMGFIRCHGPLQGVFR